MNSGNDSKEIFSQDIPEEATAAELDLLPKNLETKMKCNVIYSNNGCLRTMSKKLSKMSFGLIFQESGKNHNPC
jgi:hypothetical protein